MSLTSASMHFKEMADLEEAPLRSHYKAHTRVQQLAAAAAAAVEKARLTRLCRDARRAARALGGVPEDAQRLVQARVLSGRLAAAAQRGLQAAGEAARRRLEAQHGASGRAAALAVGNSETAELRLGRAYAALAQEYTAGARAVSHAHAALAAAAAALPVPASAFSATPAGFGAGATPLLFRRPPASQVAPAASAAVEGDERLLEEARQKRMVRLRLRFAGARGASLGPETHCEAARGGRGGGGGVGARLDRELLEQAFLHTAGEALGLSAASLRLAPQAPPALGVRWPTRTSPSSGPLGALETIGAFAHASAGQGAAPGSYFF